MFKHWPVFFGEDVGSDMDGVVGIDANDIYVVGRVVDLAQTQPVGDRR
jgi:aminopeptidase C